MCEYFTLHDSRLRFRRPVRRGELRPAHYRRLGQTPRSPHHL